MFDDVASAYITHDYVLDGTKILSETVTDAAYGNSYTLYYVYDANGSITGLHYNGTPYYFQKNIQGDVLRICNAGGAVVVEYTYDAWGNILSVSGELASTLGQYNPFRYRGYYYDSETDLYYLNSRYYDAEVGRFISADKFASTGQGLLGNNMFVYCGNNPVIRTDDDGEWWTIAIGAIIGGAISCATSIVTQGFKDGEFNWDNVNAGWVIADTLVGIGTGMLSGAGLPMAAAAVDAGYASLSSACQAYDDNHDGDPTNDQSVAQIITESIVSGGLSFAFSVVGADEGANVLDDLFTDRRIAKQILEMPVGKTAKSIAKQTLKVITPRICKEVFGEFFTSSFSAASSELSKFLINKGIEQAIY